MKKVIGGYEVYLENGKVVRGVASKGGSLVTVYPYRLDRKQDVWVRDTPTPSTLRAGLKNGNWKLS